MTLAEGKEYLHSTMYLLNHCENVSMLSAVIDLHSTMYLLNPCHRCGTGVIWINLHSTMYLLNH